MASNKPTTTGLMANCFCCCLEVIVEKHMLETLPIIKIEDEHLNILICDSCEKDVEILKEHGVQNVSFDILRLIQEDLDVETEKKMISDEHCAFEERNKLMVQLYKDASAKIHQQISQNYLNHFINSDTKLN